MEPLETLLQRTADLHHHLCPRQVIGVRMGMLAEKLLGVELPQEGKRVYAIVETDGCFCDGVSVATNCWVGRRTMRVEDYGKVGVTFVDTGTDDDTVVEEKITAWRIAPHPDSRANGLRYAAEADNDWQAMLLGYQRIPDEELLVWNPVKLAVSIADIVSRPGLHVLCDNCGEEIMNQREVRSGALTLCRSCANHAYYSVST